MALVLALTLCALCFGAAAEDIVPVAPTQGDGTEESSYQISTAAHLYWFAEQVNGGNASISAELTADIALGGSDNPWTPIGNGEHAYSGTFDGQGHTISGLYCSISENSGDVFVGLFGCVSEGTVQNVTLQGCFLSGSTGESGTAYVGGICGRHCSYSYGEGDSTLINNCSVTGTVSGSDNVGGICGENFNGINNRIENCRFVGTVTGSGNVGGVCGQNNDDDTDGYNTMISNCSSAGTVSGSGSNDNVGGVCGLNVGDTVIYCSSASAVSGSGNVGGVCGENNGSVEYCYNTGAVSGNGSVDNVGGLCGKSNNIITSCYNTGPVSGNGNVGGVCGMNEDVMYAGIYNCYWLDTAYTGNGVRDNTGTTSDLVYKTAYEFSTGAVTWLLNNESADGPWRQNLDKGSAPDSFPALDSDHESVNFDGVNYTNFHIHDYVNGICAVCGAYEQPSRASSGVYVIANAGNLYWFAGLVNGDTKIIGDDVTQNPAASAILTGNIDLEGSAENPWTPIGNGANAYTGTFDGRNSTISGLYCSGGDYVGLFGCVGNGGVVKNLNVVGSVTGAAAGGLCGSSSGTITDCSSGVTVSGDAAGGLCGINSGTITSCYSIGSVTGTDAGGVCGTNSGTITNCYWQSNKASSGIGTGTGDVTPKTVEVFASGAVTWLLNNESTNGPWRQNLDNGTGTDTYPVLDASHSVVTKVENSYTNSPVQHDDHSYVNGFCTVCGEFEEPKKNGDVYQIANAGNLYWFARQVNSGHTDYDAVLTEDITVNENVLDSDGNLIVNPAGLREWTPISTYYGTFDGQNHTISGLYSYVENAYIGLFLVVGEGSTVRNVNIVDSYMSILSIFTDNIMAGGLCGENYGTIENCSFNGTFNFIYGGTGDAYAPISIGGVCGYNEGEIINCHFTGSVTGPNSVGGVCAVNRGTIANCSNAGAVSSQANGLGSSIGGVCGSNTGAIENCSNTGSVNGEDSAGGVCGWSSGLISNCSNAGAVTGTATVFSYDVSTYEGSFGGVCGRNRDMGTIANCSNTGAVTGNNDNSQSNGKASFCYTGGVCGENGGAISNCYSTGEDNNEGVTQKSTKEFASGEVAWRLNHWQDDGPWRQDLGTGGDTEPVLDITHGEVVRLTVRYGEEDILSYHNSGCSFDRDDENQNYYYEDGQAVTLPLRIDADTVLRLRTTVTASITGTVTKPYDGGTSVPAGHSLSISLAGVETGDNVTATAAYAFADPDAGTGKTVIATDIALNVTDTDKYLLGNTDAEANVGEITPKTVTITADNQTAWQGYAMPALTYKVEGLLNGDRLTEEPVLSCEADMLTAGEFEITASGGSAGGNYTLAYVSGTLTVRSSCIVTLDGEVNYVRPGGTFTLPTPRRSGYAFLGWACSDGKTYSGGDELTVTSDLAFTASWVRHPDAEYVPDEPVTPEFPFYDVPSSAWYYSSVKYVYENGLMDGVDTHIFAPNDTLTRAMVWTIIARMSGADTTGGATWYAKAQDWVVMNGISDGENPTAAITRQELVTMLYRYAQIKGYDVSVGEETNILSYVDATSVSDYAVSAFQWACGSGLTEGDETGALTPLATATRAQAAALIMRFCENVK